MLHRLLVRLDRSRFEPYVISLSGRGELADAIERLGVPVLSLDFRSAVGVLTGFLALVRYLRTLRPVWVHTWLYHADLVGLVAARFVGGIKTCWSLRCSGLKKGDAPMSTLMLIRLLARFSGMPNIVMANSQEGLRAHELIGYRPRRWEVVFNGFDTDEFRPDPVARMGIRHELGLGDKTPLVGMIARFDPMKDHLNFLRAAEQTLREFPNAVFVMVGRDITPENTSLTDALKQLGIAYAVRLVGARTDIPKLMAALDLVVSSSVGEGFPNVVGEAMACAVVCVVTNVGDSSRLVGDAGIVVPARDSHALSSACCQILRLPRDQRCKLGLRARARILDKYSLEVMVGQYERIYECNH
jgi:glycosyltransferase involved in cell wall biosynthesis